ncbi:MAG: hypothetical protein JXB05_23835 [Myxococcaceae bacterium]|nr:hypothetical protein [Myxococcaceae bacterium]
MRELTSRDSLTPLAARLASPALVRLSSALWRGQLWPYRNGRGISPVGFIHALRIPTYLQSQEARTRH